MKISIHDVTHENEKDIVKLSVSKAQKDFIETPQQCLEEAKECSFYKPVGLHVDDQLVGFAMYGRFPSKEEKHEVWLDRFLIDEHYQGRGYGKKLVQALIQKLTDEFSCRKIYLSVYEDNQSAILLYKKFGFQFNGELDINDEKVMVRVI